MRLFLPAMRLRTPRHPISVTQAHIDFTLGHNDVVSQRIEYGSRLFITSDTDKTGRFLDVDNAIGRGDSRIART